MLETTLGGDKKKNVTATAKKPAAATHRYFIELHVPEEPDATRMLMDEIRRHRAYEFIQVLRDWLKDHALLEDVAGLSVTAMGQIMIVCTHRVIDMVRTQDVWAIAHIRSSDRVGNLKDIYRKT
jgi:hypothetical protein